LKLPDDAPIPYLDDLNVVVVGEKRQRSLER
jgi:hypothetical protein